MAALARGGNGAGDWAYTNFVRADPRPLRIHVVEACTVPGRLEPLALVAEDPDGPGPAEAKLTPPQRFPGLSGVVVAVNANAFAATPDPSRPAGETPPWTNGLAVNISAWARSAGRDRSAFSSNYTPVWAASNGTVHIGPPARLADARDAVAGFARVLRAGEIPPMRGARATALHPRTAIGVDRAGRRIWLVVVDGRRPGYSEGLTEPELGALMKELGAWDAANLDGGGSSILLCDLDGRGLRIMNRPSGGAPRPVPVLFGLKSAAPPRP